MVAYLSKSDASEGFNQIIDFLNGSSIKYALTVNPNIYVSCIKQFWTTVTVKHVNDVTRLQALVDKKKVVVIEATIREALHLDDAEGVDCLPNEEFFAELARMGYEKPSTKLTFYKAFFSSQWKFLIRIILQCDLSTHTTIYSSPALTHKVFANMRRVGKGFLRVETPLFEGMLVEQQGDEEEDTDENIEEVNAGDAAEGNDSAAHGEVPTVQQTPPQSPQVQPPSPQPQPQPQPQQAAEYPMSLLQEVMDTCATLTRRDDVVVLKDDKKEDRMVAAAVKDVEEANMQEDETELAEVQEVVDVLTTAKLITEVITAASETVTAASAIITTSEAQVLAAIIATLTAAPVRVAAASSRRRKGVVIRDPQEDSTTSTIIPAETKSKDNGKGILDIDWDEAIDHVKRKAKEDPAVKRYQVLKRKPQTKAQARKNIMMYLKNVAGFKMDYFKGMLYDDIQEDENRALQKINETLVKRAAKRRKLDKDVEDLKRHLQIVPIEDDDVYTEATLLARKVPVVDYEIIKMNKPYYKIIRADGTHQLYISFLTLLRKFDREDLEALWSLVQEIFSTAKPKNFFDDFLLTTLGTMFETPDAHA
nr:xylulose kinase-1 [Tanacetum cinerariifolium]